MQKGIIKDVSAANIYKNIRKIRDWHALSQDNMAKILSITQKHYSKIENGQVDISISMLFKIADALQIKVSVLIGLDDMPIFNNISNNQQGGDANNTINYSNIDTIRELYERLLMEKDKTIAVLQATATNKEKI